MNILSYEYKSTDWWFHKVCFQKTNLIVGDSGVGKTRLLNTMFRLGALVAQSKIGSEGEWILDIEIDGDTYHWNIIKVKEDNNIIVDKEQIFKNDELILNRNREVFTLMGKESPKLPRNEISVSILREEDLFKPLYNSVIKMLRRDFSSDELLKSSGIYSLSQQILKKIDEERDLFELYKLDLGLNPRLLILSDYFPPIYKKIISYFLETFDFIYEVSPHDSSEFDLINIPARAPIFAFKESNVDKLIPLHNLSSGMQKVLLILTDILSMPEGGVYLIDEYENSLGIGAIDFLPNLLQLEDINIQLFITSHHPYIINKFPVENWCVAYRKGKEVFFAYGDDLVSRYSISKQDKYNQLINDPIYSEGIE